MGIFGLFKLDVEKMEKEKDINGLIKALKNEDARIKGRAKQALERIGTPAVEPLVKALDDNDQEVRHSAVEILQEIETKGVIDTRAVEPLIKALKDEFLKVRARAAWTLGLMKDARAVEPLIEVLKYDPQGEVRNCAAAALGSIGDAKASEALVQALKDEYSSVRGTAATALCDVGDVGAIEPLAQAVNERRFYGQDQLLAESALEKLKARASLESQITKRDVDGLITALENKNWAVRAVAVDALGRIGDKKAVGPLVKRLGDVYGVVADKAAWALASIGDEEAVYPLIKERTRARTDIHARQIGRTMEGALRQFRKDKSLESMEKSGDVTGLAIFLALGAGGEAQGRAIEALVRTGDERAAEPFLRSLEDKEGYFGVGYIGKSRAAEILGRMRCKKAVSDLMNELAGRGWQTSDDLRRASAKALGAIGDERAVDSLVNALKYKESAVRIEAARALGKIGDPRALEPLSQALNDVDPAVREACKNALDKITPPPPPS